MVVFCLFFRGALIWRRIRGGVGYGDNKIYFLKGNIYSFVLNNI